MKNESRRIARLVALAGMLAVGGCDETAGPAGADGTNGTNGTNGTSGTNGTNGTNGTSGTNGTNGTNGTDGVDAAIVTGTIPEYVRGLVETLKDNPGTEAALGFPVPVGTTDTVRTIVGLQSNLLATWLEPLSWADGNNDVRFGSHSDFTAFLGDGWDGGDGWNGATDSPYLTGRSDRAFMWSNHEYVDGAMPTAAPSVPTGQHLRFALWLQSRGILAFDVTNPANWTQGNVDAYVARLKREVGGSLFRVIRDDSTGQYSIDRSGTKNVRFDATSGTRFLVTGIANLTAGATDDAGNPLPVGVAAGTHSNCSGGVTPWGTIVAAEENVQSAYGDLDDCYGSGATWTPGSICASGSALTFVTTPAPASEFGRATTGLKPRDYFGYLAEIDPLATPSTTFDVATGNGHQKFGSFGRAHWENVSFAVDVNGRLVDDQPIVAYYADDRRGGRIYKWVSSAPWQDTMTRAETRALLASGDIYVAHFSDLDNAENTSAASPYVGGLTINGGVVPSEAVPGHGTWIRLSTSNTTQTAPNAAALGSGTTVGAALSSNTWNSMGGFSSDDMVRLALYTAANKIGVRELNRPEDVEWNAQDQRIYVAFTNHTGQNMLYADGTLDARASAAKTDNKRSDRAGAVFAIVEADPDAPGSSTSFTFVSSWRGRRALGLYDAANPDNIAIDADGGVWFGTDGNYNSSGHADAFYYLDIATATAYRIAAMPSNAENTGPAISPDGRTLFMAVQHPGEDGVFSQWPYPSSVGARSGIVAITARR